MKLKNKPKFEFSITGFMLAIVFIAMFSTMFGALFSDMAENVADTGGNNTFNQYEEQTSEITSLQEDLIKNATQIGKEDTNFVDMVGAYFSGGYTALKTAWKSFSIFEDMMIDLGNDVPTFSTYQVYIIFAIIVMITIGVIVSALVKMRV